MPGEDGPLLGRRQTLAWIDEMYLAGFSDSCSAIRRRRFSLIVPGASKRELIASILSQRL